MKGYGVFYRETFNTHMETERREIAGKSICWQGDAGTFDIIDRGDGLEVYARNGGLAIMPRSGNVVGLRCLDRQNRLEEIGPPLEADALNRKVVALERKLARLAHARSKAERHRIADALAEEWHAAIQENES